MKGKSDDLLRYVLKFAGFAEEVWELFYVSLFLAQNSTRNFRNTKEYCCPRLRRSVRFVSTPPCALLMCCPGIGAVVISMIYFLRIL